MKIFNFFIITIIILNLYACTLPNNESTSENNSNNQNNQNQIHISKEGFDSSLEIATWNIKNFPLANSNTVNSLESIIKQLDIDIYAVQEIEDKDKFDDLINRLDDYDGFLSPHTYNDGTYQKTGIIYKKQFVTIISSELLFTEDNYIFPRPPLLFKIKTEKNSKIFDFFLIVIHLKAFGDTESFERRKSAAKKLKEYIDNKIISTQIEKDYIIAGDWNDRIDEDKENNAFQIFIDDTNSYMFLTKTLSGDSYNSSYPSWNELIDHILISEDTFFEYSDGTIKTLRLDDQISNYFSEISDHRPVMAIFPVY